MLTFDRSAEAYCEIVKVAPKLDTETSGISWDVDVAYNVSSEDEAEMLLSVFPSAVTAYVRAVDGKGDSLLKTTLPAALFRVSMRYPSDEKLLWGVQAECRGVEFKVNSKSQTYTAKMRFKLMNAEFYVPLVQALGEHVVVAVEPVQQDLPLSSRSTQPEAGMVVAGTTSDGEAAYGIYKREHAGEFVVEDFGVVHRLVRIDSQLRIQDAENDLDGPIARYVRFSEAPSWSSLITAYAEAVGGGGAKGDARSGWIMTDDIVSAALESERKVVRL
jgi:hypothetical protein